MMKRILSALLCVCWMLSLCITAFAGVSSFVDMQAPKNLGFLFSYPNEGSECIEAFFEVPDDLCKVLLLSPEEQKATYGSAYQGCVQYDWSIDNKNAFHYDKTWDSIETDSPLQELNGSFLDRSELFWFSYDTDVERCKDGVVTKTKMVEPAPDTAFNLPFAEAGEEEPTVPDTAEVSYTVFDFAHHNVL